MKTAARKVATKTGAKSAKRSVKVAKRSAKAPAKTPARVKSAKSAKAPRAIKSPLSKKQLDGFREKLLHKRRQLVGDMNGMEAEAFRANRQEATGDLSTMPVHMADIGTDNYEQEFTLGLLESERQLLREIDEALDRVVNKTYGVCLGTSKPIGKTRLNAKPWAKYCIDYARMIEQGQVQANSTPALNDADEEEEVEGAVRPRKKRRARPAAAAGEDEELEETAEEVEETGFDDDDE